MKGKIIEFEGIDGCFKETNSKKLTEYLNNLGIKTTRLTFPTYNEGSYVSKFLKGEYKDRNLTKQQIAILFAIDRFDEFKSKNIKERLEHGEWFVIDRYVESNIIYQAFDGDNNIWNNIKDYIYNLEYEDLELPKADIVIAMYPDDIDFVIDNIIENRKDKDIYESDKEYIRNTYKNYKLLLNIKTEWIKIKTTKIYDSALKSAVLSPLHISLKIKFRSEKEIFDDIIKELQKEKIIVPKITKLETNSNYSIYINNLMNSINMLIDMELYKYDKDYYKIYNDTLEYSKQLYNYVDKLTKTAAEYKIMNKISETLKLL